MEEIILSFFSLEFKTFGALYGDVQPPSSTNELNTNKQSENSYGGLQACHGDISPQLDTREKQREVSLTQLFALYCTVNKSKEAYSSVRIHILIAICKAWEFKLNVLVVALHTSILVPYLKFHHVFPPCSRSGYVCLCPILSWIKICFAVIFAFCLCFNIK